MKTSLKHPSVRLAGFFLCTAFVLTGFDERSSANAASPEASQPPSTTVNETGQTTKTNTQNAAIAVKDTIAEAWEKSKNATFKQRDVVRERMKAAEVSLDAKIVEWTAKKDAVAEESKPAVDAAHKEVREAREVLSQKINALDNATEETWSSVKAELNTAWQRMITAVIDLAAKLQSS
jgi:hypothetical protein